MELGRPTIGRISSRVRVTVTDSREPLLPAEHAQLVRLISHIAGHNRGAAKGGYRALSADDPGLWDSLESKLKHATKITIERMREV